ncbi:lysylphosphatidylglycerol synthase transmembrane domain-containing protein [Ilyomonas limi]|uniref:lysylphosphatidylglycerol synthase transmembrane domain-containing protein n=1 Tax=Ilyomonas limi TaxID=2575867 RepID=UPI001484F904|nr:lysylphosphatidylglycerol synthase transmembrane domain-containing protein [Ilyomonas limi]
MKNFLLLNKRYKILINYIAGPLLFLLLAWSIYTKLKDQYTFSQIKEIVGNAFSNNHQHLIIYVLLLMCANWSIEAFKWKILMQRVQPVSFFRACKAVLSGLSFSLFIPNGVGDYIGRTLYMREGNRLRSVPLNVIGSISQLIVTLTTGVIGLFYLKANILHIEGLNIYWLNGLLYAVIAALIVFLLLFFKISWFTVWFEKIPFIQRHRIFVQSLEQFDIQQLTHILMLSVLRYAVFIIQYFIVFRLFNVNIPIIQAAFAVSVLFLLLAVVPAVPSIAELGVRSEVSRQLFGLFSANAAGIVFSAAFIWIINLIIPALAGTIFITGIKLFKKQ